MNPPDPRTAPVGSCLNLGLAEEFAGVLSPKTVERFVTESFEQLATKARFMDYLPVLTRRFARERLRALMLVQGVVVFETPEVLFVCVHNAGRSQMAAAFLTHLADGRLEVRSAGSASAQSINPTVVQAMRELGIDISANSG